MINPIEIPVVSSVLLIDPVPVYLTSVAKPDKTLVQEIFAECENDCRLSGGRQFAA